MTGQTNSIDVGVAVIGMAGRFPGADSVDRFWQNLCNGVESIERFSCEDLKSFGISPLEIERAEFIPVSPVLEDIDCFDAAFFGYSPREAELMDPQQRIFLECAWHALEASGYPPSHCPPLTAVYAGTSMSSYLLYNVLPALNGPHAEETLQAMIANDKDFLSSRVSYKLNLSGPSVDVQTGCSTSLVAIHFAFQSLLSYQSDMALAGGVSIQVPQRRGYLFQKGALYSPDGHCRAFDAAAEGTLFGSGVGIVVLKRLDQAIADGDHIHAILRATAINNDGNAKVGYTAPSIRGQSEVIRLAHAYAGVSADSIGYVECHGTGTPLGDPAEITALTKAFRAGTQRRNFCALGSVKSNIGHLDAAAGVASFIKATLAVEHGVIPPSLHFVEPHPDLGLETSPFYVNASLSEWSAKDGPRRAGVSSFGIGGTNAHVIVEEPPAIEFQTSLRTSHALTVSARSKRSLDRLLTAVASDLEEKSYRNFADIAYTTQMSRSQLPFRCAVVASDLEGAKKEIRERDLGGLHIGRIPNRSPKIVFMFPGGGAQHANMTVDLYREDPRFAQALDRLLEDAEVELGFDLRPHIFPKAGGPKTSSRMRDPLIGLTALFLVEYALAEYWIKWGVKPHACIGHSLGEYVAACIAGILNFTDALGLVVTRSRLMEKLPAGAMLSVPLSLEEVTPFLTADLSVAAINGPSQTVISGGVDAIQQLTKLLLDQDIESRQIQVAVSSHSHLVEPILGSFRQFTKTLQLNAPKIPCISNVTGEWLSAEEATNPEYWVSHLRQPVLFRKGIKVLADDPQTLLLEVGPGTTLTTLVRTQFESSGSTRAVASMRHPYDSVSDSKALLLAAAQLWASGVEVDWAWFYANEKRRRVPLPSYPFEQQRFWLKPEELALGHGRTRENLPRSQWLHHRTWRGGKSRRARDKTRLGGAIAITGHVSQLAEAVRQQLSSSGHNIVSLEDIADSGSRAEDQSTHEAILNAETVGIADDASEVVSLLHFATHHQTSLQGGPLSNQDDHFDELLKTVKGLGRSNSGKPISCIIVTNGICRIDDDDTIDPVNAFVTGLALVAGQEFLNLRVRLIDIEANQTDTTANAKQICDELNNPDPPALLAIRGTRTWEPMYEPLKISADCSTPGIRQEGVYLITGGLGNIGLELATFLAKTKKAKLALLARTTLPERVSWPRILASEAETSPRARRIRGIEKLEALGSEVLLLNADVSNRQEMAAAFASIQCRFGVLHGIFHLAGVTGQNAVQLISDASYESVMAQSRAKTLGAAVIEELCNPRQDLDFVFLFSSSAAYLGGTGLMAYSIANSFLDSIAQRNEYESSTQWVSANWDAWLPAEETEMPILPKELLRYAISTEDGCQTIEDIVRSGLRGPLIVSTADPELRIHRAKFPSHSDLLPSAAIDEDFSSDTDRPYSPPSNEFEHAVTTLWKEVLGKSRISIHDNFFEIGGTSLIALRLLSRLKRDMQIELPIISLFERPTVASLAAMLSEMKSNSDRATVSGDHPLDTPEFAAQ